MSEMALAATNGRSLLCGGNNISSERAAGEKKISDGGKEDDLLVMQVRAFLRATEEIDDIDVETVEDLMQTIPVNDGDVTDGGETSTKDCGEDDEDDNSEEEEHDVSALYLPPPPEEAQEMWAVDEVEEMMNFLKERGMSAWLSEYLLVRKIPILRLLGAFGINLCDGLRNKKPTTHLYFLKVAIARVLRYRDRLSQYGTIADAVNLIQTSRRILILTGAGISVSCGIPDFRSRDGLYASLKERGEYDLDDPQQMFDINYFRENPAVFYSFAHEIYPSKFKPSPCHRFIKLVEQKQKLLRNYTQNIDTLETVVGVERVLQCHGSFTTATCLQCRRQVVISGSEVEDDILTQRVSLCTVCNPLTRSTTPKRKKKNSGTGSKKRARTAEWENSDEDESEGPMYPPGIMKPDITFFGEKLKDEFDHALEVDRANVDLLLVIGTSLKVSPVAEILSHLPHSVPQILINKTPIRHINPDIILLGNADDIIRHLCSELQWDIPSVYSQRPNCREHLRRSNTAEQPIPVTRPPERVGSSHVWLYEGAEGGKWLQEFKRQLPENENQVLQPPMLTPASALPSSPSMVMPKPLSCRSASMPLPGSFLGSVSRASTGNSTPCGFAPGSGSGSGERKRAIIDLNTNDDIRALKKVRPGLDKMHCE